MVIFILAKIIKLTHILDCTVGKDNDENFSFVLDDIETFLGLLYLRGRPILFLNEADVHDILFVISFKECPS